MTTHTILGVTARRIDELPAAMGGAVRLARACLGLSGFGVQVMELPPGQGYEAPEWTVGP